MDPNREAISLLQKHNLPRPGCRRWTRIQKRKVLEAILKGHITLWMALVAYRAEASELLFEWPRECLGNGEADVELRQMFRFIEQLKDEHMLVV